MTPTPPGKPAPRTLTARLAPLLPIRLVAATARAVYPRFEPELARLADLLPPDCGTAVDVGGWYGPWTHRLWRHAREVVTVEPVPHLARLLEAAAPAHARVVPAAASDRPGTARLWLPPDDEGDRGVSSLVRRDIHARAVHVPCVTLDGLGLRDVGFIKIDVDGSELAVLHGATGLLARDRPALFVELESRIQPIAPVVTYLSLLGYEGWVLPDRNRDWVRLAAFPWRRSRPGPRTSSRRGCCGGSCRSPGAPATSTRCSSSRTAAPRVSVACATMDRMPETKRPASPFGPLDFQLVLLRRMADHNRTWSRTPVMSWASRSPTCARPTSGGRRCCTPRAAGPPPRATARSWAPPSRPCSAGSATWTARPGCGRCPSGRTSASRC